MEIYKPEPQKVIRLAIKKKGSETEYLNLIKADQNMTLDFLDDVFGKYKTHKGKGYMTSIEVRESVGNKNGKSISYSFRGPDPHEARDKIIEQVMLKNTENPKDPQIKKEINRYKFYSDNKKIRRHRNKGKSSIMTRRTNTPEMKTVLARFTETAKMLKEMKNK